MIKEHDLLWVPNFIALGIYFLFRTKFSWNEGIDTCFNVDFLGGYLVVIARYWWLLLVSTFSMNALSGVKLCEIVHSSAK